MMSGSESGPGTSVPIAPHERGKRRRVLIVVAITVIVVVAGIASYEVYQATRPSSSPYPLPPAGWAAFKTAWNDVASAFQGLASGPWTIYFGEGVAADAPWSPPAAFWDGAPSYLWQGCLGRVSGVSTFTFWNSSLYPYSDSSTVFSSGAAPLWTFTFNGTGTSMFVVTWLTGHITVNGAFPLGSPCYSYFEFDVYYQGVQYNTLVNPDTEVDSNVISATAIQDSQSTQIYPPPTVPTPANKAFALYFPGQEIFLPDTTSEFNQWTVVYGNCGLPGQLGSTFNLGAYVLNATHPAGGFMTMTGRLSCFDSYYRLNMTSVPFLAPPNVSGQYRMWNLTWGFVTSAVPPTYATTSLSTGMLHWELKNDTTPPFVNYAPSAAVCGSGTTNLSNCTPPAQGWYAVLLNQNGDWIDSYPSVQNGTAWSIPSVAVSPGDRILFVGSGETVPTPAGAYFQTVYGGEPAVFAGDVPPP